MKNKPYFPMFIDLSDKNIVVAGGGNIATRRIKTLLKFTRNITVVATKVTQELLLILFLNYYKMNKKCVENILIIF